jgi:xanthine dehydrogenase accessory factor
MNSISTWKLVRSSMEQGIPVMLLYVLESWGSSPGRQGFFMAVNEKSEMDGSIGGGMMEHKFIEMAKEQLKNQSGTGTDIRKQVHDKSAVKNQSGMICSGEQTILLHTVQPAEANQIENIIHSLERLQNGTLILSPAGIRFSDEIPDRDYYFSMQSEHDWLYTEKTGYKNNLYIIGGGHCSLALSRLMRSMDFYIRVYDDRDDLKTMVENDAAHEKYFISGYEGIASSIPQGDHQYIVIMTFGYRSDDIAIRSLLGKKYRFLGVLGSQTKINKLFDDYRKDGINEKWLQDIHSPVGLEIKSQTPEEIAVSIAAEIIRVKNA